mmetsp:Transcript_7614/g.18790  ORF Transcript_7614/g.18790 Transcript_7614/m.18790 type:complete len:205 (+) Transcript_7614:3186-3800(+)
MESFPATSNGSSSFASSVPMTSSNPSSNDFSSSCRSPLGTNSSSVGMPVITGSLSPSIASRRSSFSSHSFSISSFCVSDTASPCIMAPIFSNDANGIIAAVGDLVGGEGDEDLKVPSLGISEGWISLAPGLKLISRVVVFDDRGGVTTPAVVPLPVASPSHRAAGKLPCFGLVGSVTLRKPSGWKLISSVRSCFDCRVSSTSPT